MAEEISSTVKKISDGKVSLSLEAYQDLMAKAAEKAPVVYRTIQKTPEMVAAGNKHLGAFCIGGGLSLCALGAAMYVLGVKQTKAL